MAEKVTYMVLKVDLQCSKCYKKVKKVLCKFPQIQDQVYDEKNDTVKIKVVCCSPEKIRDKIRCKGGRSIKSIEILKPPEKPADPPKPADKPKEKPADPPKPADKPKEKPADPPKPADKPKEKPADPPKLPPPAAPKPADKPADPSKAVDKPADPSKAVHKPAPTLVPAPGYPPLGPVPVGFFFTDCYQGQGGGPCYNPCYGQPVRYYNGYYGRPVYDSWGGGGGYRGYSGSRCGEYFSEEDSQGCTIM